MATLTHPIRTKQIGQTELEAFVLAKYGADNLSSVTNKNATIDNLDLYGRGFEGLSLTADHVVEDGDSGVYHVEPDAAGHTISFNAPIPGKIFLFVNHNDDHPFEIADDSDQLLGTVYPRWSAVVVGGDSEFSVNLIPNNHNVSFSKNSIDATSAGVTNVFSVPGDHVFILTSLSIISDVESISATASFKVTSDGEGLELTEEQEIPLGPTQPYNFKSNQFFAKENADVVDENSSVDFEVTAAATGSKMDLDVAISGFFKKKASAS